LKGLKLEAFNLSCQSDGVEVHAKSKNG